MGYGRALLQKDVRKEEASLQKKATKKSLWGSIGRTIGGLGAMALTGGVVNPLTVGLISGGASFLGGAIGAKASGTGDLSKQGKFFKSDRESIQKELGAFGTQNLMSSLKSGLTAGMGQKLKLMKSGKEAAKLSEGFGMDFKGSMLGKGLEKRGAAAAAKQLTKAKSLQAGEGMTTIVGDSTGVGTGTYTGKGSDIPSLSDLFEEELSLGRPTKPSVPLDLEESFKMPWEQGKDIEQFSEFGKYGAMEESLQQEEMFSNWQSPSQAVGESFPVSSPTKGSGMSLAGRNVPSNEAYNIERGYNASQYSAGKTSALDAGRHKEMQDMMNLQNRFSNRSWDRSFRK